MNIDRWKTLKFNQKLGNIASEITRARLWQEKEDENQRHQCLERAIELLDLTLATEKKASRLKETARMREVVADWYSNTHIYDCQPQQLEDYAMCLLKQG